MCTNLDQKVNRQQWSKNWDLIDWRYTVAKKSIQQFEPDEELEKANEVLKRWRKAR